MFLSSDVVCVAGDDLHTMIAQCDDLRRRDGVSKLSDYLGNRNNQVCILSGLQSTGKTTMIMHAFAGENLSECAYIDASFTDDSMSVAKLVHELKDAGIRKVAIDEITKIPNFVDRSSIYNNIFTRSGMKIILSGTDSLRFGYVLDDTLMGKSFPVCTTLIPFREYSNLTGIRSIDQYIAFGGVLFGRDSELWRTLNSGDVPKRLSFRDLTFGRKYIDSAVARNIQNTLNFDKGRTFSALRAIADEDGFPSLLYRFILDDTREFVADILNKEFLAHDFAQSAKNLEKHILIGKNEIEKISRAYAERIDIRDVSEKIGGKTILKELRRFLHLMDCAEPETVVTAVGKNVKELVFNQPALRWALTMELVDMLANDGKFVSRHGRRNADEICMDIVRCVQGRLLEDIVLRDTRAIMPRRRYSAFKFRFNGVEHQGNRLFGEYDMVLHDRERGTLRLFEVKHARRRHESQTKNLRTKSRDRIVQECLDAEIVGKYVLYNGPTRCDREISHVNVSDFLMAEDIPSFLENLDEREGSHDHQRQGL